MTGYPQPSKRTRRTGSKTGGGLRYYHNPAGVTPVKKTAQPTRKKG